MSILLAILAIALLIVLHELGHFAVARWCGMKIYEFSIGFGPRLWYFTKGETEYSLRAIFLGGYVRIAGMHPDEEDAKDERSFLQSSAGKRFAVIAAGPLANYLTAIVIFILIFAVWGSPDHSLHLQSVKTNKVADAMRLQPGDQIISVNKKPLTSEPSPSTATQLHKQLKDALKQHTDKSISLMIMRDGQSHELQIPQGQKRRGCGTAKDAIGLSFGTIKMLSVWAINPSINDQIPLKIGDQIKSINNRSIIGPQDLRMALEQADIKSLKVELIRDTKKQSMSLPMTKENKIALLNIQWRFVDAIQVKGTKEGSIAQAAGIQKGDQLIGAMGQLFKMEESILPSEQLRRALAKCGQNDKPIELGILRAGKQHQISIPAHSKELCAQEIEMKPNVWVLVMKVLPNSTAANIGLQRGDRILEIDGQQVSSVQQLLNTLQERTYRTMNLKYERQGQLHTVTVPMAIIKDDKVDWRLGFHPQLDFTKEYTNPVATVYKATHETWMWNVRIWEGLSRIFRGTDQANLTGPVGIVRIAQQSLEQGFNFFLWFVAIISIHLAFFNLLPIPALDGGRLLFLMSQQVLRLFGGKEEWVVRVEMVANVFGFVILFGLLILITFKDIFF